jgi:hypothetical protein
MALTSMHRVLFRTGLFVECVRKNQHQPFYLLKFYPDTPQPKRTLRLESIEEGCESERGAPNISDLK